MKTMTCNELGGACDESFSANSFEEMAELSKQHGMEMFQKGDEAHLKVMGELKALMEKPGAMEELLAAKRRQFDELAEDQ